jgi:hypothetical protein
VRLVYDPKGMPVVTNARLRVARVLQVVAMVLPSLLFFYSHLAMELR